MANSPSNNRKRIFVSYGHDEHIVFAERLKKDLEARGHEVWFDADRIIAGDDWESYIDEGLRWASERPHNGYMVLIMTPHSVRRPDGFCLNELARAMQFDLKIIPVMLVWSEPPLSICRIQWLDMQDCIPLEARTNKYKQKFGRLLQAIEQGKIDFEGIHSYLFNTLKPIVFDAEINQNLDRFTGREWVFDEIKKWLSEPKASKLFWLTGSPGVGKTAIAAWLCTHMREVVAFHFCRNDNVQKIDPRRCVMSLSYQLSTQLPEYEERLKRVKLGDITNLNAISLFDSLIVQPLSANFPSPDRTMIVLIDALDEAGTSGRNELASFIASEFERTPDWLKLIITSRPDPEVIGSLQAYTPFNLNISDLRNDIDISLFLAQELKKYNNGRAVPPEVVESIVKKSDGLFLYAEWILRELASGRLSISRIGEFPRGLGGIYLKYFERQFPDLSVWESSIRPALDVMAAAQEPLTLKMLSRIFGWGSHEERKFRHALGSLFQVDRGVIKPFHRSVMEWLTSEEKEDPYFISAMEGHGILADYGWKEYAQGTDSLTLYMLAYLPVHLFEDERWQELKALFGDIRFILLSWRRDRFELIRQWTVLEQSRRLMMADIYGYTIANPAGADDKELMVIIGLLQSTFHFYEALKLLDYVINYYRVTGETDGLQQAIGDKARILITMSNFDDAMVLLKEQEQICRKIKKLDGLQTSLCNQANILWIKNNFGDAMVLLKEQEQICRDTDNMDGLQESLGHQGMILRAQGDYDGALYLLKKKEQICREIGQLYGLQIALLHQGFIIQVLGNLDSALALFKEQEQLSRKLNNKDDLGSAFYGQAIILRWRGDLDGSMRLNKEVERICREIGNRFGLQEALREQAVVLRMRGDLDGALKLIEKSRRLCLDLGDKYGLQCSYGNEAVICRIQGDLDKAMRLHNEEELICREIGHRRDLAMSLDNQAVILRMKGDLEAALALHRESEHMLRSIGFKYGLQECLGEQAITLYARGDINKALMLLEEQEKICGDMGLKLDLDRCIKNRKAIIDGHEAPGNDTMEEKCMALPMPDRSVR